MMFPGRIVACAVFLLRAARAFSAEDAPVRSEPPLGAETREVAAEDQWGDDEGGAVLESTAEDEWGDDDDGEVIESRATASPVSEDAVDDGEGEEGEAASQASPPAPEPVPDGSAAEAVSAPADDALPARAEGPAAQAAGEAESAPGSLDVDDGAEAAALDDADERRVGDPVPLSRRAPLLPALGVEVAIRYGLVGTGPTRFINDIRFGVFDWLELRTTLAPYPASLMARVGLGDVRAPLGQVVLEGGLAYLDAGLRLAPEEGEAEVGVRAHVEGALTWHRSLLRQGALYAAARWRSRLSMLSADEQHAVALELAASYDLLPYLALTGGLGYAQTALDTPVRELAVNFVEHDRPGMAQFLVRNDGETQSLTWPMALTYGRVENFDVDLFVTTRLWPRVDVLFGAGVRWRWGFGRKPWEVTSPS